MKDRLENYTWQGEEGNDKQYLTGYFTMGLGVAGSGPVGCHFFILFFSSPCSVL